MRWVIVALLCLVSAAAGARELCVGGHPAPRPSHVTYGGLLARHGYVRDHIVPLCLGGADELWNMQYQEIEESYRKDAMERQMCEAYCRGAISLEDARKAFIW